MISNIVSWWNVTSVEGLPCSMIYTLCNPYTHTVPKLKYFEWWVAELQPQKKLTKMVWKLTMLTIYAFMEEDWPTSLIFLEDSLSSFVISLLSKIFSSFNSKKRSRRKVDMATVDDDTRWRKIESKMVWDI